MAIWPSGSGGGPPRRLQSGQRKEARMAEVVNLNRYRKAKARAEAKNAAPVNRAKHGLSKLERQEIGKERDKLQRDLDGKKID